MAGRQRLRGRGRTGRRDRRRLLCCIFARRALCAAHPGVTCVVSCAGEHAHRLTLSAGARAAWHTHSRRHPACEGRA
eukprot:3051702-Prymnesium_polylepis.1